MAHPWWIAADIEAAICELRPRHRRAAVARRGSLAATAG